MGVGILATVVFCIAVTVIELVLLKSRYNTEASNSMETSSETIPTTTMTIPTTTPTMTTKYNYNSVVWYLARINLLG